MNQARRNKLKRAIEHLNTASELVEDVLDQEQDCVANYPENLQGSQCYEKMEEAADSLDDAIDSITQAVITIDSVITL